MCFKSAESPCGSCARAWRRSLPTTRSFAVASKVRSASNAVHPLTRSPFDNFSLSFAGASAVAPRASMAVGPFQGTSRIEKTINTSSGKSGGPIQRAMPIQKPKSPFVNVIGSETNGPPLVGITTDRTSQCSCGFSLPAGLARTDFVVIECAIIPRLQLWTRFSTQRTFAS